MVSLMAVCADSTYSLSELAAEEGESPPPAVCSCGANTKTEDQFSGTLKGVDNICKW